MPENKIMSIRRITKDELITVLESGKESELYGVKETEQIEFKQLPYDTKGGTGKKDGQFELAKDVAAIANSRQGGGIICIGVVEERSGNDSYAKSLHPVDKSLINEQSWRKIISNGVHPHLSDDFIEFKYYKIGNQEVFCIIIQETLPASFPLLAIKRIDNEIEYFFVPYRPGARSASVLKYDTIHQFIQEGLTKKSQAPQPQPYQSTTQRAEKKNVIEYAEQKLNTATGFFFMKAVPQTTVKVNNLYDKSDNKIYSLLANPPVLREMGWDLRTAFSEQPVFSNNQWETSNGTVKLITVDENLEVFAAGTIGNFLDWGLDGYSSSEKYDGKLINNFALVEFIDRFIAFLVAIAREQEINEPFDLQLGFKLPKDMKVALLRPFHLGVYYRSISESLSCTGFHTQLDLKDQEVKYVAGKVVQELYARCFGETDPPLAYLGKDEKGWYVEEERYTKG